MSIFGLFGFFNFAMVLLPFIPTFLGILFIIVSRGLYIGKGWSWKATIVTHLFSISNIIITFAPLLFLPQPSFGSHTLSQSFSTPQPTFDVARFLESDTGLISLIFNIANSVITLPYMLRSKTRAYFGKVKIDT